MPGLFRIILFFLLGYIIVKSFKFFKSIFASINSKKQEDRVYESSHQKSKIDKKDVIDAQFEEIEDKDNSTSHN